MLDKLIKELSHVPWSYVGLVYIGTVFYTLAAYYHLTIKDWTWFRAASYAIPLVLIEYIFSLRGNHHLNASGYNPVRIVLITMCFYFINTWLLNYFIIHNEVVIWREVLAFLFVLAAFYISTNL